MKNIIKLAILLMVLGLAPSCSEDYLDVNTDPNNPTQVSPDLVLPVAQLYSARIIQGDRRLSHLGNMMMYNWSQSDGFAWYPDEFKYLVTSSFYQTIFNDSYSTALKQYEVLNNLEDAKYDYYKAIAMIMKSFHYQLLVDCYGDVPYTEALGRSVNATPVYDNAQSIYSDLIVKINEAITLIKNAGEDAVVPSADDAMFGGNMVAWVKFANTLKMRILVRESDVNDVSAEVSAILAEGTGFIEGDVMVNPGFTGESGKLNVIYDYLVGTMTGDATCATDYILEYLTNTNDPRIDYLYEKPSGGHLGVPQGLLDYDTPVVDKYVPANVSNVGPGILKSAAQGAVIFTLAERYFNQAEAENKGLIPVSDGGKASYESGITASFLYLGLTAADAETYYSQVADLRSWDSSPNKLKAIITQKWIAFNGITAEQSWFDYSRTGYPAGLPRSMQATSDRPVRLFYVAGEYSSNGDNVPDQPDAFTDKIFWAN